MESIENNRETENRNGTEKLKPRIGITGNTLKWIAILTMVIDHLGASVLFRLITTQTVTGNNIIAWYRLTRNIGRVSFPIFCFLLVEGFLHTGNVKKYAISLGCFAILSELPFDLAFFQTRWNPNNQNVFFTLFLGLCFMIVAKKGEELTNLFIRYILIAVSFGGFMYLAELLETDYGAYGVLSIGVLYLSRENRLRQLCVGALSFIWEWPAPLGMLFPLVYNGTRGKGTKTAWGKYFFYAFYPLHLLFYYGVLVLLELG
ncbi:MAG: conjugal transfer protein TraX [Lachnospiraceae bacterium]|nr:conjugal transfer protein TraX [Lachnospiraceae bacterium]